MLDQLVEYPASPRPSYADQLLGVFRDAGCAPQSTCEVREIHTALGLVASEAGITIVPHSMRAIQRADIVYRPISDARATSPVLLSHRRGDERAVMALFLDICRMTGKTELN
nr:LysR substrate-binding domain-containing protein [Sphingobium chlorophenolicum]